MSVAQTEKTGFSFPRCLLLIGQLITYPVPCLPFSTSINAPICMCISHCHTTTIVASRLQLPSPFPLPLDCSLLVALIAYHITGPSSKRGVRLPVRLRTTITTLSSKETSKSARRPAPHTLCLLLFEFRAIPYCCQTIASLPMHQCVKKRSCSANIESQEQYLHRYPHPDLDPSDAEATVGFRVWLNE